MIFIDTVYLFYFTCDRLLNLLSGKMNAMSEHRCGRRRQVSVTRGVGLNDYNQCE